MRKKWLAGYNRMMRYETILKCLFARNPKRSLQRNFKIVSGQATTELALLLPILFCLFFGAVQVIIYLQSATMTQYASYVAARSFQVYGNRNLGSINYRKVASAPFTNESQTIAEAAAETVMFESLMWEQRRIKVLDQVNYLNRVYEDGNNELQGGQFAQTSTGVVQVKFVCDSSSCDSGAGVEVQYCMPIAFPGISYLFEAVKGEDPCKVTQDGRTYSGVAISHATYFGREPTEK